MLQSYSLIQISSTAALAWASWEVVRAIYNLYLHPLARYPGPRLAAVSTLWKLNLEVIQKRSLSLELVDLHNKYGEIIRIGPNELHFSKPSAFHDIYNPRNRWAKDPFLYDTFADEMSTLTVGDYEHAKKRRDVMSPLFSRKAILNMQYLIQECFSKMCDKIEEQSQAGDTTNFFRAFRCAAIDAICSFSFARSMNALDAPGFEAPIEAAMHTAVPMIPIFKHFKLVSKMMRSIPPWLVLHLDPAMKGYVDMRMMIDEQVKQAVEDPQSLQNMPHPTIYQAILEQEPSNVPSIVSLRDEGLLMINAGVDTVSFALSAGTLHILDNPEVSKKLHAELLAAWPKIDEPLKYEELESLPYLRGVVRESLRFSHGAVHPMTRIVPVGGATVADVYVPEGTVVSVCPTFVHNSEDIFPNASVFDPERWIGPSAEGLEHWLVSFSKGPRACLGVNLAWCELYIAFAYLFRRFDMTLEGVKASDWKWRDCYLPQYEGPPLVMRAKPCEK